MHYVPAFKLFIHGEILKSPFRKQVVRIRLICGTTKTVARRCRRIPSDVLTASRSKTLCPTPSECISRVSEIHSFRMCFLKGKFVIVAGTRARERRAARGDGRILPVGADDGPGRPRPAAHPAKGRHIGRARVRRRGDQLCEKSESFVFVLHFQNGANHTPFVLVT